MAVSKFGWSPKDIKPVGICAGCLHLHADGTTCDAFPEGIPRAILLGEIDHKKPVPGDNGIQFEPREVAR